MRVTICGHAALFIETSDQRILLDPCFSDTLVGGALTYHPARVFDLDKMPAPTALVITHSHFDHFHLESLEKLPRDLPVITADEQRLVNQLRSAGFSRVIACEPWRLLKLGKTHLLTTPSDHEEPEFGLLVRDETSTFWHMADSEVTVEVGERLIREQGSIELISAKYQPVVRASMGYIRGMGATFDRRNVVNWLEAACACDPALIFPYASGLCFRGRHQWFNRYAFPLSPEEVVGLLQRRLGQERATTVQPGDVIELRPGQRPKRHMQASPFVREKTSPELRWEPVDLSTLTGLAEPEERQELQCKLEAFMAKPLVSWLKQQFEQVNNAWAYFRTQEIVWQLVVHAGEGERLNYFIDFRSQELAVLSGEHPEANFFSHVSGQALYEVLKGDKPGLIFWLAGEVRSYEKIIGVRDGRFWFPKWPEAPEDSWSDPLTYYLRHFGTGELSDNEFELPNVQLSPPLEVAETLNDITILAREGENRKVMAKKVLLAYLAVKEAERIGLEITDDEIQAKSDEFRLEVGLLDSEDTEQWLEDVGLSLEAYSAVMRDFAVVLKLEKHYANIIESLLTAHRRVATAQTTRLRRRGID